MADRSFGPTVLGGLAAAALAAVAGNKRWVGLDVGDEGSAPAVAGTAEVFVGVGEMPLFGALALVLLACWGVVLVSRGRWRRVVVVLALLSSLGLVATWITGLLTLQADVVEVLARLGAADTSHGGWTAWFWASGAAALVCVATTGAAVLTVGRWPAMGSRYDAPASAATGTTSSASPSAPSAPARERDSTDLWKAIDEGRDPTADQSP